MRLHRVEVNNFLPSFLKFFRNHSYGPFAQSGNDLVLREIVFFERASPQLFKDSGPTNPRISRQRRGRPRILPKAYQTERAPETMDAETCSEPDLSLGDQ